MLVLAVSCNKNGTTGDIPGSGKTKSEAALTMDTLWLQTTPYDVNTLRKRLFSRIQPWADAMDPEYFKKIVIGTTLSDKTYTSMLSYTPILECYDYAFDRVLEGLGEPAPAKGEIFIWHVYNMGYVVRTYNQTFAIDVFHRRAAELEPYIDFYLSTHAHNDHKAPALMEAMCAKGKPVVSNYYTASADYCSNKTTDYKFGEISIHSFITPHNYSTTDNMDVTIFQIDCPGGVILHSGDSNFNASLYDVTLPIDIYIPRYAPNAFQENNIIDLCNPKNVLLSHILELCHAGISGSRWSLEFGLDRASLLHCSQTYMPFWGEKMVWSNGTLK